MNYIGKGPEGDGWQQVEDSLLSVSPLSAFWPFGTREYFEGSRKSSGRVLKQTAGNQSMQVKEAVRIRRKLSRTSEFTVRKLRWGLGEPANVCMMKKETALNS